MPHLHQKLQLKPAHELLLLHAPNDVIAEFSAGGAAVAQADAVPATGAYDAVLLFVQSRQQLEQDIHDIITLLKPEGMLWIAYPKKTSSLRTDLTRDNGWSALVALGYETVRQVALNAVWSALRFRHRAARKATSSFGVDPPGIDRKAKTVAVPDDLQQALEEAGLLAPFSQLAFTHRKEYVVAVLAAKRPETRANRIRKVLTELAQKQ